MGADRICKGAAIQLCGTDVHFQIAHATDGLRGLPCRFTAASASAFSME
ncbi:MAG: hypothetical protein ACC661_08320 [Verrucomicrobiales bacterium]